MKIEPFDPQQIPEGATVYRMSGIGWCPEKHYHGFLGSPEAETDPVSLRRMELGDLHEPSVLKAAEAHLGAIVAGNQAECALRVSELPDGVPVYILGHIDGEALHGDLNHPRHTVVDSKVTAGFAYKKYRAMSYQEMCEDRTLSAYKAQIGGYALARGADSILIAIRNRDTNSKTEVWEDMFLSYDLDHCLPYVERAIWNMLTHDLEDVQPWECRYCKFADSCDRQVQEEATPPELGYQLLEQYRTSMKNLKSQGFETHEEYEAAKKEIEKIKKKARAALLEIPVPQRRPMHAGFSLTWSDEGKLTVRDKWGK